MAIISQSDALPLLRPYMADLHALITRPWDEYHTKIPPEMLISFCARTRASALHNLMLTEAYKLEAKYEEIRVFERSMMRGIVIADRIAIRFKKLDEESMSRGHYTRQVRQFRAQDQLDGIDAAHHLEAGYVLNHDETDISEVRVACPSGRGVAWWARLDDAGLAPVVVDLFDQPPPDAGDGGATIKPKELARVIKLRRKTDEV